MSNSFKISEHESVDWIFKKIPKFSKSIFSKKINVAVTSFDVNEDVFIMGTEIGYLYYINRNTEEIKSFILNKDITICQIKVIQTINLSIAAGMETGSIFILKIPIKNEFNSDEINLFNVPVEHNSTITCITWSKNSEKLFTGDIEGHICCSEVDDVNKKVSSYHLLDVSSQITELCYDYKCLVISTESNNFIYNLSTNNLIKIGSKPRNQIGQFGACFLHKLCKPEEVEIVVIRPDSKVWISDLNDKSISLLPSLTSQTNTNYAESIQSGNSKYQLGLVNYIEENAIIFWSKNGIIIFDISTGKIVSSTCNLGAIISVSFCHVNVLMPFNHELLTLHELKTYHKLLEIWILRKPLREEESTLLRLSMLPLKTSKLTVDNIYDFSNCHKYNNRNELTSNVLKVNQLELSDQNYSNIPNKENLNLNITEIIPDKWLPKFDLNVSDTFQELTKKTKEILKQSQEIFDNTNDGVEQALELTEEGLIIEFDKKCADYNTCDIILDSSLKIKSEDLSYIDSTTSSHKKHDRKINFVNLDLMNLESDTTTEVMFGTLQDSSFKEEFQNEKDTTTEVMFGTWQDSSFKEEFQNEKEMAEPSDLNENLSSTSKTNLTKNIFHDSSLLTFPSENAYHGDEQESDTLSSIASFTEVSTLKNDMVASFLEDLKKISSSNINSENSYDNDISTQFMATSQTTLYEDNFKNNSVEKILLSDNIENNLNTNIYAETSKLTDNILLNANKWITHRGPLFSGYNKITSMAINRRMIWLVDTLGTLHVGFKTLESQDNYSSGKGHFNWYQNNILPTNRLFSSPEGVILWRERYGEILVYTGITKIWTQKVVLEKVLLKSNWEQTMCKIKDIDIDNDMAVIITTNGKLKVMNDISDRVTYKQSSTASITGHVTLATTLNGIIWCVTEIIDPETKRSSQHIFACTAKDEDNKLNLSYWKTVPIPKDLISESEEHLGILGGTSQIKYIQLGTYNLAWIVTFCNSCFFNSNISSENPTGNGVWYQISLNFLFQISTSNDEMRSRKTGSNNMISSVLISVKAVPKKSLGNGIIWLTTVEKNSPCILFESDKDILGHGWVDCFSRELKRNSITSLPPILAWSSVTFGFKNVLWLVNNSNEIYCYWEETRIKNIAISSSFGKVVQIAAQGSMVVILTITFYVLARTGITIDNPTGTGWIAMNNTWNTNKDDKENKPIKHISCFENELWVVTNENIFYIEDFWTSIHNNAKKNIWKLFEFKLIDSLTNTFSSIQVAAERLNKKYIWSISESYVYLGIWDMSTNLFNWTYIHGPKAKSIHISDENLWMVEQVSGEIYVRCGINFENKATGDYWIHIPLTNTPVKDLSSSSNNKVVVIDSRERLLSHVWTIIKSNASEKMLSNIIQHDKSLEGDWELLN